MHTDFTIVASDDAVVRLRASFPDIWSDLLESADPDTPSLLYFAFGCFLLDHRGNSALWSRAYRFFDDVAEGGSAEVKNILTEAFDRLSDSDIRAEVEKSLGPAAQHLFRRSSLK
jgi:hypothetical protein